MSSKNTPNGMRYSYTILHLPETERPRERLLRHGPEAMSTAELIAIILGSGMKGMSVLELAQEIVVRFGTLPKLAEASVEELCKIKELGHAKALQLKAAFSLGLRLSRQAAGAKYKIEYPVHAYNLIKDQLERENREMFVVILQDARGYVMSHHVVSVGTLSNTLVHPREVFYPAIRHSAASMVVAHNHPSGDPSPSKQDYEITQTLVDAGRTMRIPVHDHIIVGANSYVSLREKGFKFN